jgi:non-specific serine/threonine protein kinase
MAECHACLGQYDEALERCRSVIELQPYDESAYRQKMRYHYLMGNRSEALRTYQACAQALKEQLDVDPAPETRALEEQIFKGEVCLEGYPRPATPPRPSLRDVRTHNLPAQTSSFVGREKEMQEIRALVDSSSLVTVTGIGGTGKTRMSLQVASALVEDFADGVWLVELASLTDSNLVTPTVAAALRVKEQPGQEILETLKESLRMKHLLLVLDNCEHLVDACATIVSELLKTCPRLRILATSRQCLQIAGERVYALAPLSLPEGERADPDELLQSEAVQLFTERAQAAKHSFELSQHNATAIAYICRTLDGIPLALELAAARMQVMTSQKLAEMLDDRFRILSGGARTGLPRHETLRALMDWSYDLLTDSERLLLQRLSIFRGGCTLEATEAVCAGGVIGKLDVFENLSELVQKSLVVMEEDVGQCRYQLLETVRQYAREKLVAGGEDETYRQAHAQYFLKLAEEAEPQLAGAEQVKWLNHLESEHDNLRAALDWFLGRNTGEEALQLGGALGRFWLVHGHLTEGRERLRRVLEIGEEATKGAQAKAWRWAGGLAWAQGNYDAAKRSTSASLERYRDLGDSQGMAFALNSLGNMAHSQGDYVGARGFLEKSLLLCREQGDKRNMAIALLNLGNVAHAQGDHLGARGLFEDSLVIFRELGDKRGMAYALNGLGNIAHSQGDYVGACRFLKESLAICRELGDKEGMAYGLSGLANAMCSEGHGASAARVQGTVTAMLEEMGAPLQPLEKADYNKTATALKAALGEDRYLKAFEAGKAMLLEQAIEYALKDSWSSTRASL